MNERMNENERGFHRGDIPQKGDIKGNSAVQIRSSDANSHSLKKGREEEEPGEHKISAKRHLLSPHAGQQGHQQQQQQRRNGKLTIVLSPAAELFVQIKGRGAIAQLDIRKPLGDDVQKGRVQANGSAN